MNVLPVLADLSPPPKLDLSMQGSGSSVGNFARILDQRLSETAASGGMGRGGSPAPSAPYVSPTRQGPEPTKEQPSRSEASASSTAQSEASSKKKQKATSTDPNSSAGQETARGHNGASKSEANRSHPADKETKSADRSGAGGHRSTKEAKASAADQSNQTKTTQPDKKKQSIADKTGPGVSFPGALVLAGAHKGTSVATNSGASTTGASKAVVQTPDVAKGLLKGSKTSKDAKQAAAGEAAAKKTGKPAAKGSQVVAKHPPANGAIPTELLAAPPSTNPAAPQAMAAATHSAPEYSKVQQDPGAVAGHNGTTNQTAAVTIVDLRQNNQNSSSSTGQNGSQSHSSDGGNVRLFQLADGAAGSIKLNGQAGMARAAGAPAGGQNFSAFTDQIVKQTGILLKSNNSGEIRLVLKPENLGNLRIKLDLNNNSLSGKIFVQNHEALRLVQQNLDSLYRALRDSGFTATELNVSVGGRDNGQKSRERSSPLPSMRAIGGVKGIDKQAPALETAGSYYSLVNLMI